MKYLLILLMLPNFVFSQILYNGDFENLFQTPNAPSQIDRAIGWKTIITNPDLLGPGYYFPSWGTTRNVHPPIPRIFFEF